MDFPPKMPVVVGGIVVHNESILFVHQTYGLFKDMWSLPSGFVDHGERPDDAVVREIQEEAGITAEVLGLQSMTIFVENDLPHLYLVFICRHVAGTPTADGTENDKASYFSEEAVRKSQEPVEGISRLFAEKYWAKTHQLMTPIDVRSYHQIYTTAFI
jgi:ADP-ribose pyrophosphatase YjhB (NUDIX family)